MDRPIDLGNGRLIDASRISWRFDTSSGPGGQHANRSNTRVEATLLVAASGLAEETKERIIARLGPEVRVSVDETRSQTRNREIALERLESKLKSALVRRKRRRATKPTRASQRRRVEAKRRRSQTKSQRGKPRYDD